MTTELEQEFFKVFGVEPTVYSVWDSKETQIKNFKSFTVYPEITDSKLLEMICIVYKTQDIELTIDDIKNEVLNNCIKYKNDTKQQIQQLFKEEE